MQNTCTIWVCQDCIMHHANGGCGNCHTDEGHDREPLCLVDNTEVTMGLLDSEHDEDCQRRKFADNLFASTYLPGSDYECDCEIMTFSYSSCEGCGSTLGGERHAMTLWFDSDGDECPGHYDDDATLTSGAGIGEATYCDGTCQ